MLHFRVPIGASRGTAGRAHRLVASTTCGALVWLELKFGNTLFPWCEIVGHLIDYKRNVRLLAFFPSAAELTI